MSKTKMKTVVIAAGVLALIAAAGALSWLTTGVMWDGGVPVGQWSIHVQDPLGNSLGDAHLTMTLRGKPYLPDGLREGESGVFDNYTGPEGVSADDDGVLRLRNTQDLEDGGTYHRLFWIWHIGDPADMGFDDLLLSISVPGYETATLSVADLFEQEKTTVTLHPSN